MTELETQLLNAFEQLHVQHKTQQKEFVKLYNSLVSLFKTSQQDNAHLQISVSNLTEQVQELAQQLQELEKLYSVSKQ